MTELAGRASTLVHRLLAERRERSRERQSGHAWGNHYKKLGELPLDGNYRVMKSGVLPNGSYLVEMQCPDGVVRLLSLQRDPPATFTVGYLASGQRLAAWAPERIKNLRTTPQNV